MRLYVILQLFVFLVRHRRNDIGEGVHLVFHVRLLDQSVREQRGVYPTQTPIRPLGHQVPVHEPLADHRGDDVLHLPDRVHLADVVTARELVHVAL